ncbi:MAG: endonuclease, partial [Pseudomonadota bacterium]
VSPLLAENTTLEAFHINAGRRDAPSDHDPLLVTIAAETPEPLPEVVVDRPPVADTPPVVLDPTPAMTPPTPPSDLAGTALRDWLKRSWYDGRHRDLGYKQARIEMYSFIDVADDGRVYGVYSGFSQAAAPVSFLNPINAEHTQPQSTFNQRLPMRSDIHHLFPTHMTPNQARGREPFGEIPDSATEQWFSVDSAGRLFEGTEIPSTARAVYGEDRDGLFEPPEAQKGDTARALFYFHTMYPGLGGDLSDMGNLATLGAWHRADPPDAREIARNARVETVQGNRNPFVDVPELACRVFARTCP